MSNLRPLDALRARLQSELEPRRIFHAQTWGNPRAMTEVLRNVKRELGGNIGSPPGEDLLKASLLRFFETRQVSSFTELKYVCYGLTVPVGKDQRRLIDQRTVFDQLVGMVREREAQPRQFRRCYQGLLTSYFGFDWYSESGGAAMDNWTTLRDFLQDRLKPTLKASATRGGVPDWLQVLNTHHNLLTDDPCSRYALALGLGDSARLKEVCTGLGIAGSSWVWSDALMAYVRLVCESKDGGFRKGLDGILNLVNGRADITLPPVLAVTATALSVVRYFNCGEKPEHPALRDTSLHWIGNPWLNRTAWDAYVKHEPTRQMIEGWLKRRLIKDFFELLAQDGSAELRRLNYWLNWEPQISDMWFVLGGDARRNRTAPFVELRKRMAGRDRVLSGRNDDNNAFVMRIGALLVIEFGITNNACYVFAASDFRSNLDSPTFSIFDLKQRAHATRLSHIYSWERRFDQELKQLLQSVPRSKGVLTPTVLEPAKPAMEGSAAWQEYRNRHLADRGSPQPPSQAVSAAASTSPPPTARHAPRSRMSPAEFEVVQKLCAKHGIEWEDNRRKGGALWILIPDRKSRLTRMALTLSPTRDHGALSFVEPLRARPSTRGRVWVVAFAFAARCVQVDCPPGIGRSA